MISGYVYLWICNQVTITLILDSESFTRWLIWGTSASSASAQELEKIGKFLHPHRLLVHKIQFLFYHLVVFECPYHLALSALLKLHSFSSKMTIHRSPPPPKVLGQKARSNH